MQSGVCGDGKLNLNKGEQCDPPGIIEYATGCVGSIKNLNVCSKTCRWTASTTLCSSLSKCGNGSIEFGETCDDGSLNGKYNHCNFTCNGVSALGKCGDGTLQSTFEICDPGILGQAGGAKGEKYALTKTGSCSWDCQNFGPYCGDTVVQSQYGEECEGSQTCSIEGNSGAKVCTSNCLKQDSGAAAWWRLEKFSFLKVGFNKTDDGTANANVASCTFANCPTTSTGKYGYGREFTSATGQRYLTVAASPSLEATSSLTVEAWINPANQTALYQRIVEKGGPSTGKGYDLEFNVSAVTHTVRFNLWNNTQTSVDSKSFIPTNTWTHVVGTYSLSGTNNVAKIYINGVLENTININRPLPIMAKDVAGLAIGKSAGAALTNFFFGSLDEIKIYNRTLSAAEIQNNFQSGWYCSATTTPVVLATPGSCGDNVVDSNEACDRGVANNGRACAPTYGALCSYCSTDCQNTIEVQPTQYCGNGIIESVEKCEADGNKVYAAVTTTGLTSFAKDATHNGYEELACLSESSPAHTLRKGTKTCVDCAVGTTRNCVQCGVDTAGVGVSGNLINVLDNAKVASQLGVTTDPLFAKKTNSASLSLSISKCLSPTKTVLCPDPAGATSPLVGRAKKTSATTDLVSYTLLDPYSVTAKAALINSSPICSTGDTFADKYQMYVNNDWTRPLSFTVMAEPQTWQNDLVLSPVVSNTIRAKDLRVVVSWVGATDFYSGVFNPFSTNPQIEGSSFTAYYCDNPSSTSFCLVTPHIQYAQGTEYYNAPASYKYTGVWYHGFNFTPGQTNAEAFTIDTSDMTGNTYAFYVRSPSYPIRTFRTTARLKVDVYLPELDSDKHHFGTPARTFYLQAAIPSDNQNARFWQVFNVTAPGAAGLSISNILGVDTIVTSPANFLYTNPLLSNPGCTNADWSGSTVPTCTTIWCTILCPSTGFYIVNWTKLTNCRTDVPGAVNHPPSEVRTCIPLVLQKM